MIIKNETDYQACINRLRELNANDSKNVEEIKLLEKAIEVHIYEKAQSSNRTLPYGVSVERYPLQTTVGKERKRND